MIDAPSFVFEDTLWQQGYAAVAGVDEAGRGPLAGPVVAAAVMLPPNFSDTLGINDSKKLSEKKRNALFPVIQQTALCYGIGLVDHAEIDAVNILQATYKAMQLALSACALSPDYVLIDGRGTPRLNMPCRAIVKGDSRSVSIAAASILAKVTRDRLMLDMHVSYPVYGFAQHKGYPTRRHIRAIREFGLCPIHRRSFRPRELEAFYAEIR